MMKYGLFVLIVFILCAGCASDKSPSDITSNENNVDDGNHITPRADYSETASYKAGTTGWLQNPCEDYHAIGNGLCTVVDITCANCICIKNVSVSCKTDTDTLLYSVMED